MDNKSAFAADKQLSMVETYIEKTLDDSKIPGLAVAIVKDDEIVYLKGFGMRNLGNKIPVTEKTVFQLGSTTKAFTATALGILVDENKLTWDTKVREIMPEFQLLDGFATQQATVRDLLIHNLGLGDNNGDLAWYFNAVENRTELIRRLRFLKGELSFRERWSYSNLGYLVAGELIPAITQQNWDDFIENRLLKTLRMNDSFPSSKKLTKIDNLATPYGEIDDSFEPIKIHDTDLVAPAGAIYSNAQDMAQWLRFNLGQGKLGEQQIVSPQVMAEIHNPQAVCYTLNVPQKEPSVTPFMTYSFGWGVSTYRGYKTLFHAGQVDGMSSVVGLLPEQKLGVVFLSNSDSTSLLRSLVFYIFDTYLQVPPRDWAAEYLTEQKTAREQAKKQIQEVYDSRLQGTKPSLPISKYVGNYFSPYYGTIKISEVNGKLRLQYGDMDADLEHWHQDQFNWQITNNPYYRQKIPLMLLGFDLSPLGTVDGLIINFQVTPVRFVYRNGG